MGTPLGSFRRLALGGSWKGFRFLLAGGLFVAMSAEAQTPEPMSAERAAQALKESVEAETRTYHLRYGPAYFRTGAEVLFGYTDNLFYSEKNRQHDFLISPQVTLGAFVPVSEINTLKLNLGLGYEYYPRHHSLNSGAPLVNPDTELLFHLFVGDARIRLHENFSYQETLFYNAIPSRQDLAFNFTDVGEFKRWDNVVGANVDYDFRNLSLSAGYDHENFTSTTEAFDYLTRSSELFNASAGYRLGDAIKIGPEGQASINNYDNHTVMADNWRARVGPFVEVKAPQKITVRAGGGYDTAHFDDPAEDSDYKTYYAYGRISQETRLFTHSVSAGREHMIGDNANNLETTYVRYAIVSPIIEHVELRANTAIHFADEFGGVSGFRESFTYYLVGCGIGYQIHKYWRTDLAYQIIMKQSDVALRNWHRNRVTLSVSFTF